MSGVTNEEDQKPTGDQGGAHINLKVKSQEGNEVFFRIKRSTQFKKLMNAYCDRQSVEMNSIAFLFDGRRLRAEQTPDEDGNEVFFRIKRNTQLKKLMNAYCDRQSVELNSIAFLFDGRRLRGEQTPDELEMEEDDEIDAMLHQTGGGGGDEDMMHYTGDQGAYIHLKVKGQGGNELIFRIKRSTKLKKLLDVYCDRQSVELNSIAFLLGGRRLRGEQTPDELEMEEGDEIDAMLHQTGVSGAGIDEAKTPNTGDQGAHINLNFKDQGGNELIFRMKRSTKLKKLMDAYCDRQSVEFNSIVFLFYGRRLLGEQTPDELEMVEGDEIYAMPDPTGGIYRDLQMKLSVISI